MTTVRYLVNDVDRAVGFHTGSLGFALKQQFGPAMAILTLGDTTLMARRAGRVHRAADAGRA